MLWVFPKIFTLLISKTYIYCHTQVKRRIIWLQSNVKHRDVRIPTKVGRSSTNATSVGAGGVVTMGPKARSVPVAETGFSSDKVIHEGFVAP